MNEIDIVRDISQRFEQARDPVHAYWFHGDELLRATAHDSRH